LIEFAKRKNYFIMEFINIVKLAKVELYWLYVDHFCRFEDPTFNEFNTIFELCKLSICCVYDANFNLSLYLGFQASGKTYVLHKFPNKSYVLVHIQHIRKSLSKQQRTHDSRLPSTCALSCWHVDFLIMIFLNPSHGILKIFIKWECYY
jgi:hypothetical protein